MISEKNFVSISELRDNTAHVVKDIGKVGKKILLSQNKPIGVFLSIDEYNTLQKVAFEKEIVTKEDIQAYRHSSHGEQGVEAFTFLASLK